MAKISTRFPKEGWAAANKVLTSSTSDFFSIPTVVHILLTWVALGDANVCF
jgi:hypothetical protein